MARKRKQHMKSFKQKRPCEAKAAVVLPFYAAGYGVPTDFFDSLLCQSYFTPELLRFAQELLCMDQRSPTSDGANVSSSLSQIPLPESFAGKLFGDLFTYLLTYESVIAIGLYRNSASRATLPYVYTVPKRNSVLRADDFVFILAQPHTQIALENAIDFEADVVESRIKNMHITKCTIQAALHQIKLKKQIREGAAAAAVVVPQYEEGQVVDKTTSGDHRL